MGKGLKRTFSVSESSMPSKKSRKLTSLGSLRKKSALAKFKSVQGRSPETKFFDQNTNTNTITQTGVVQCINFPVEGADYNNRVGRKIEMTSYQFKGMIAQSAANFAAAGSGNTAGVIAYRISLVYDKQPTPATAVTYNAIYNASGTVLAPYEPRLVDNIERFEVLKEWYGTIDTANKLSQEIDGYVKMNHEVRFNSTNGGTVADITTGALYLVYATDVANGANNPMILGVNRVRFRDL